MTRDASPADRPSARLIALLPIAAVALLVLLFLWKMAFTNLILARGDTFLYFYPYWTYRAQALLGGRLPLWDPLLFMGAPFLANSQAGVLYPLNWPLALLPAPQAVKVAVLLHLIIAALGGYALARRALGQSVLAACLAAALFSLGGYLTSQIEHVNQLQGLAWLPWLILSTHMLVQRLAAAPRRLSTALPPSAAAAVLIALQILAGHTQTAFISFAGAGSYAIVLALLFPQTPTPLYPHTSRPTHSHASRHTLTYLLLTLLVVIAAAVALSAAQVLPTLELSGQSLRTGGLPLREALSFSLDPRLLGRALLPGYSRALFSEFVTYLGVVGLALAVAGLKRRPEQLALLVLAALGLGFALGVFDPLYALLAAFPPFNLFRAPARWLALFAVALALLAGSGLDAFAAASRRRKWAMLLAPLGLMALTPLAARLVPAGETGPLGLPQVVDVVGWLLPLAALAILVWLPGRRLEAWRAPLVAALALVELFVAGGVQPYNHLTTPDAYTSIRPAMTQLLAPATPVSLGVPGRFLSMSALRFDPGDLAELRGELDPQLPADAVYDAIIATKNKEVLSPNLPLAWGIPAVDGYDGGVLPLRHYADFTQLFTGAPSSDGRLRENLTSAPDPRLLSLVNGRYLVTDKVDDAWVNGVFYDLQFTLTLAAGQSQQIAYLPAFQATALTFVGQLSAGQIAITTTTGDHFQFSLLALPAIGEAVSFRLPFPSPATPAQIVLTGPLTIRGLSLVDQRSGAFQSLTLGPYRLVHSGDVKIYENLSVLPRAFVAARAVNAASDDQARAILADPAFDPAGTVLLPGMPGAPPAASDIAANRPATITTYLPERVSVTADGPGTLLLTDAFYPGWTATVDGAPAPIQRADVMFRGVLLPAGQHQVEFSYSPRSVWVGLALSGLAWAGLCAGWLFIRLRKQTRAAA